MKEQKDAVHCSHETGTADVAAKSLTWDSMLAKSDNIEQLNAQILVGEGTLYAGVFKLEMLAGHVRNR